MVELVLKMHKQNTFIESAVPSWLIFLLLKEK